MCMSLFFCSCEYYEVSYTSSASYVNLLKMVTSGVIPLKAVADEAMQSLKNMRTLLTLAAGFLRGA